MSIKKYKFISPGVFINEIDNSQLPKEPQGIGPMVIGRTRYGRAMQPNRVESLSQFVELFGNPAPGGGVDDVYRASTTSILAPTYASYAAMAWLANAGPINVVRLLGKEHASATTAGKAGWMTKNSEGTETTVATAINSGGAYGLFLISSASTQIVTGSDPNPQTGALGAVWYVTEGAIRLSGSTLATGSVTTGSNGVFLKSNGNYHQFTAEVVNSVGTVTDTVTFNFDRNSPNYIRDVFNTDPTLTNSTISTTTKNYWLGETFERFVLEGDAAAINRTVAKEAVSSSAEPITFAGLGTGGTSGATVGVMLGLEDPDAVNQSNHRFQSQAAQTGWFVAQSLADRSAYTASALPRLFKLHALEAGQYPNHNLKIEIDNIAKSKNNTNPYGTFDVVVRELQDSDATPIILERFSQCDLNPNSTNYIGRKIGTKYIDFSATQRRNIEYGKYNNQSQLIRVEINQDLENGSLANKTKVLPFGVWGPPKPKDFSIITAFSGNWSSEGLGIVPSGVLNQRPCVFGASQPFTQGAGGIDFSLSGAFSATYSDAVYAAGAEQRTFVLVTPRDGANAQMAFTGAFLYPSLPLRLSSSDGGLNRATDASFGYLPTRTNTSKIFDESMIDIVRPLASTFNGSTFSLTFGTQPLETSWIFSMDNLVKSSNGTDAYYKDNSYIDGASLPIVGHSSKVGYEAVLEYGFNSFVAPLFGGFDGLDITERDPFRNTLLDGKTEKDNYAYNSVKEAIDIVSDAEQNEFNVAVVPGIYEKTLTSHLLDTCEDRGDALAIMDLDGDFKSSDENTNSYKTRVDNATVGGVVANLRDRNINSSYGAAYFPWVQILDSINNQVVMTPPSVVALGALASSERESALWFAPAGFNRGGLSGGQAGLNVVGVTQKLTSKNRDDLYEANVNPIASFPAEGIVIFGQKTLQVTPSALDRINVRRLMIFLKKRISRMANGILFDQNVATTWNRFLSQVNPFLDSVKSGLGLTDFKVILDNSTTTPDLVDRNILYAKIFLKPARAIEYIAIDFNISRTGASFDD
jgi:hypothetical protein